MEYNCNTIIFETSLSVWKYIAIFSIPFVLVLSGIAIEYAQRKYLGVDMKSAFRWLGGLFFPVIALGIWWGDYLMYKESRRVYAVYSENSLNSIYGKFKLLRLEKDWDVVNFSVGNSAFRYDTNQTKENLMRLKAADLTVFEGESVRVVYGDTSEIFQLSLCNEE